jgi:hypothetical protein
VREKTGHRERNACHDTDIPNAPYGRLDLGQRCRAAWHASWIMSFDTSMFVLSLAFSSIFAVALVYVLLAP